MQKMPKSREKKALTYRRLPDEILNIIFHYLQPAYALQEGDGYSTPWSEGRCDGPNEVWGPLYAEAGQDHATVKHDWIRTIRDEKKYHPTVVVNRIPARRHRRPAILDVGAVCRDWRRASLEHTFWKDLAWHRLLDFRPPPFSRDEASETAVNKFFLTLSEEPARMARVRSIWLDLPNWRRGVGVETLLRVLSRIPHPDLVHTLVLEAEWNVLSNIALQDFIARKLRGLKRIFIGGVSSLMIYSGFRPRMLKLWASNWVPASLTHFGIRGNHRNDSDTWRKQLSALLARQTNIRHLSVDHHIGETMPAGPPMLSLLPHLTSLCVVLEVDAASEVLGLSSCSTLKTLHFRTKRWTTGLTVIHELAESPALKEEGGLRDLRITLMSMSEMLWKAWQDVFAELRGLKALRTSRPTDLDMGNSSPSSFSVSTIQQRDDSRSAMENVVQFFKP
ncbi:uncharacterized protein EV422DRAFT_101877 [Fimicolochytrium jonesii]|uniref:uncharacterized protein n=1 Tax=Fimicolochytrium jonesii TaxID=1396493 RepID=UPI0022FDFC12|nr:uncharacterized protein EV422DRAFT_101877 [Fimicolochytrium jonesii]KAI8819664.1 hypothetical protein EV422DRAFT_101877 [Fimicolochytrium jonesii]